MGMAQRRTFQGCRSEGIIPYGKGSWMVDGTKSKIEIMRSRWSAFMDRNVKVIRTVDFGLGLACAGIAWTSGGDMSLVAPALIIGFIFAAIGVRSIPDMSKFWKLTSSVAVGAVYLTIGCFLYWHFHPKAPDIPVVQKPVEPPKGVPASQRLSRLDHFIFTCDVPPPDSEKAAKFPQVKEELRQRFNVWGDVVGMSITVTDIRGGFRIDAEANTEEAKRRMFTAGSAGASKVSISIRRIDQQIIVDVASELPKIFGLMLADPSSQDTLAIQSKIEDLVGVQGKCRLL